MSDSDAGFSVEGRDWPAKVNYFDKQQTRKRANAPVLPPTGLHQGKPSLAIKTELAGSPALGLLGCTWLTNTAVLQTQPQFKI